jgi:hypothetical protein
MSDVEFRNAKDAANPEWSGLAELDRALTENRLTEYRLKKAWSDPWSRALTISVLAILAAGFAYLAATSLLG